MELTKEEMLEKLRTIDPERQEYAKLERQMKKILGDNEKFVDAAYVAAGRKPGFLTHIVEIIVAIVFWFLSIPIFWNGLTTTSSLLRVFAPFIVAVIAAFVTRYLMRRAAVKRNLDKVKVEDDPEIIAIEKRANELSKQMSQKLGFLDECYCTPWELSELEKIFRTGRADTLKEGLNALEESIHRRNMEQGN